MTSILILSENLKLKSDIRKYLTGENYSIAETQTPDPKQEISSQTNVIIFDASSFADDVSSFINQIKMRNSLILVIVIVKQGDVEAAVQAMRAGAVNVLALPIDKHTFCKAIEDGILHQDAYCRDQIIIQQAIDLLQSVRNRGIPLDAALPKNETEQIPNIVNRDKMQIGDLSINIKQKKAFYRKEPIDLTPSQFKLLVYLAESNGRVIPFDELYFHLHSIRLDLASARTALTAHMSYLRNKLTAAGCGEYLVNVRGRGYIIENIEERNIHTTNANLDLILEQLPIILWTTSTELRVTSILGAGLVNLGLESSRSINLSLVDFLRIENLDLIIHAHQQAILGKSSSYEQTLQGRILEMHIEPSFSKDDEIIGCIGLALDITERKEAEEAYHLLVNHSLQGLTIFQNNRIVFANKTMAEITGYTIEEILSFDDPGVLIYPEDRSHIYENIKKRLADELISAHSEYRIIRKDGTVRWIEQASFINNFRGQTAIHTAATDRTQEKQAVESYRQLEETYRILAKNLPKMAILLFDYEFRYIIAEGQALEEMGYYRDKIEGKTIWEVLPLDRAEALIPYYRTALNGDENTFEWIANNRIYEIQTLPVKKDNGMILAGMFIIQDITRHRLSPF